MDANPHPRTAHIPCNGRTTCCYRDAVRLLPGDDESSYKTEPHPYSPGMRMLAHQKNGMCYYASNNGCTIHHRRPAQCREMDCRNIAMTMTYTQARKMRGMLRIWQQGKRLKR